MKGVLSSISITKHATAWTVLVEVVPVGAFEFLKDAGWYPTSEHTLAFVVSFTALLFATGFASMRLRDIALETDTGLTT